MELVSIFHGLALLIYLVAGFYVLFKNPSSRLNRVCFASTLCFSLWSLQMAVFHFPGTPVKMARIFLLIGSASWIFFPALLLWFVVLLTENRGFLSRPAFYLLSLFPGTIGLLAQTRGAIVSAVFSGPEGYRFVWSGGVFPILYICYYAMYIGFALFLLQKFRKTCDVPVKNKRAQVILITVGTQAALISFSAVILPHIGLETIPELASLLGVIWVAGLFYGIVRYHFLTVSPAMAAENILAAMAESLILLDAEGRIVSVNPAGSEVLGVARKDLTGAPVNGFLGAGAEGIVEDLFQGREVRNREAEMKTRSHGTVPVLLTGSVLQSEENGPAGAVLVARDIRELRSARQALAVSDEKYRNILENIVEAYFECDLKGSVTFWNQSLCEILGYPPEEIKGINYRDFAEPSAVPRIFEIFNRTFRTGLPELITGYKVIARNGDVRDVESSIDLLRDAEGNPVGFSGVVRDVTERLRNEEEKARLEEELHKVQKLEAVGTLAGGVAHDFNNLLMGLYGNLSLMLLGMDKNHPHHGKLREMEKCVRAGAELTKQLLNFARKGARAVRPVDMNALIKETAVMFSRTRKEIRVHTLLDPDSPVCEVDPGQMEQVFLNLFVNAWQAMPEGGDLTVETRTVKLPQGQAKDLKVDEGAYLKILVRDTGVGMDEETVSRAFEPFFTTKEAGRGTGLGLSSVYGIVTGHDGALEIMSRPKVGTTFCIYLPLSEKKAEPLGPEERLPVKGEGSVLLVDDEPTVMETTRDMLEKVGYKVLCARGGQEAVDVFKTESENIDLVILDLVMPGMSGTETYSWISLMDPAAKVLISSGYDKDGRVETLLERGCSGFIRKPYDIVELSRKVRDVLKKDR